MEPNLVQMWLRKDPVRWIAGSLAGVFAGAFAMGIAMTFACAYDFEIWFPLKLIATSVLGSEATEVGPELDSAAFLGGMLWEGVCAFLGFVFAHFTYTNVLVELLAMGLTWGTFSWIFIWNLFLQSFHSIHWAQISSAAVFPICIGFGLALSSVALFDRMIRGNSPSPVATRS